jgi:hypothetical protein
MSSKTLSEIEASIAELGLADQVRLLQYLTPRIAGAVLKPNEANRPLDADSAWQRLSDLGDRLAATSVPGAPSLTDAVSQQRR